MVVGPNDSTNRRRLHKTHALNALSPHNFAKDANENGQRGGYNTTIELLCVYVCVCVIQCMWIVEATSVCWILAKPHACSMLFYSGPKNCLSDELNPYMHSGWQSRGKSFCTRSSNGKSTYHTEKGSTLFQPAQTQPLFKVSNILPLRVSPPHARMQSVVVQ